jgi:hypothetical protein
MTPWSHAAPPTAGLELETNCNRQNTRLDMAP